MLSQRLFGSGAAPAAARRACCSAARPAAAALPRCQGAVRGSLLQQAVRHNSSGSGSKGWKATEPDLAHDIAYQCPPGASLHAAPEGFDASAAAAEEAERYAAIAAMTQPEAEVSAPLTCCVSLFLELSSGDPPVFDGFRRRVRSSGSWCGGRSPGPLCTESAIFVLKTRNFVLASRNCALRTRNCVSKMMNFAVPTNRLVSRGVVLAQIACVYRPVERLQQHLKDHFTNQQREAVTDPVTNNAAAAAKNAAEAQAAVSFLRNSPPFPLNGGFSANK